MLHKDIQKKLEIFRLKQEEKRLKDKLRKRKKQKKKKKEKVLNDEIIKTKKKRKVGRHKKRGPKKKRIRKKIIKIVKERPVFDFKIVSVLNGKQNGYVGQYQTYIDANKKLSELNEDNKKIIFPRKIINSTNIDLSKDEYLLLEKNRFGDKINSPTRNEFGKIVKQKIINNEKWVIRDKIIRLVEETFWVYGFDPKTDRKTCTWIYDNLLIGSIDNNYDCIRLMAYKNKLIIKYDNKPLTMVLCKNKSDCIRLYNFFSEKVRDNKIKQIICIGAFNIICDSRREIESDIANLTGWTKMKIQRSTN